MSGAGWKASFLAMRVAIGERAEGFGEVEGLEPERGSGLAGRLGRARGLAEVLLALARDLESRRLA
jgi:hypothetical protein